MGKKHQEGFTLIELLMLVMVVAITLGLGVPAFSSVVANNRMTAASNSLVHSLHLARSAATTQNRTVILCAGAEADGGRQACDPGGELLGGWIVFVDENQDGAVGDLEQVLEVQGPVHESIRASEGSGVDSGFPQYLAIRGDGMVVDVGGLGASLRNIQLCDGRGAGDLGGGRAAGRWIAISPTGRPAMIDRTEQLQGADNPLGGC